MTFKILSPDEAKRRARADIAEWERQRKMKKRSAQTRPLVEVSHSSAIRKESRPKKEENVQSLLSAVVRSAVFDSRIAEDLITKGASVSATGVNTNSTMLIMAAKAGRLEAAEFLINHGAHVEQMDDCGWTALHWAAHFCKPRMVEFLIRCGADVNSRNNIDVSVLDQAILGRGKQKEQNETIAILKIHGARC